MIILLASYSKSGNTIKIFSTEFKEEMKELNYL